MPNIHCHIFFTMTVYKAQEPLELMSYGLCGYVRKVTVEPRLEQVEVVVNAEAYN